MKTLTLIISILVSLNSFASEHSFSVHTDKVQNGSAQDTLLPYLTALNLNQFIGKPIDSLLVQLPTNYIQIRILPGDKLKNAHMLYVRYESDLYLGIIVNSFQFMNPNPPKTNWDIALMRKEKIAFIEIYKGINCINGCL